IMQLRFHEVTDATTFATAQADAKAKGLKKNTKAYNSIVARKMEKKGWKLSTGDPVHSSVTFPFTDGKTWYKLGPAAVLGSEVSDAFAQFGQTTNGWTVQLTLNGKGTKDFGAITTTLAPQNRQLGIVLDK